MIDIPSHLVPQAPDPSRIRAILLQVSYGIVTRDQLTRLTGIRHRHVDYVKNAARALNWMEDEKVTARGDELLRTLPNSRQEAECLRDSILASPILQSLCPDLLTQKPPTRADLARRIEKKSGLGGETADLRANTLLRWRQLLVERGALEDPSMTLPLDSKPKPIGRFEPFDSSSTAFRELRDRISKSPRDVVFVTGAGVSKMSGLPLWFELRDLMVEEMRDYAKTLEADEAAAARVQIDKIANYQDLWQAFPKFKAVLGRARYVTAIKKHLDISRCPSNPIYDLIWRLRVHGLVTYNLDRLPHQSYSATRGRSIDSAHHGEPGKFNYFLQSLNEFILQAHGDVQDDQSWVFAKEERDRVLASQAFHDFLVALMMTKVVVIVGFNPNDATFEDHVIHTLRQMQAAPRIFVITHIRKSEVLTQYSDWGLRVVQYNQRTPQDHTAILALLQDIASYAPDSTTPPAAFQGALLDPATLTPDEQLASLSEEEIRNRLNSAVAFLVQRDPESESAQLDAVRALFTKYPRSTHKAWLFEPGHPDLGRLFGREVLSDIAKGAFGQVYKVRDVNGEVMAAKVMLEEVRRDPRYFLSFRRGINSMKILEKHKATGMVRFHDAFEVPPTIFMEYIDGKTLEQALADGYLDTLEKRLGVLIQVATIVAAAHQLDEVVLHRDIKPANIMIRNPVFGADTFDVVVLDFDLSWHQGANEKSVQHSARMQGYAAPEQSTEGATAAQTRNTAVDSFGLGMLVFFLMMGRHPHAGEQHFQDFEQTIHTAVTNLMTHPWRAIPIAIARLVVASTRRDQAIRPSVVEMVKSLAAVSNVLIDKQIRSGDSLLLMELLARLFPEASTSIQPREFGRVWAMKGPPLAMEFRLSALPDGTPTVDVIMAREQQPYDKRATFDKYVRAKAEKALKQLKPAVLVANQEIRTDRAILTCSLAAGPHSEKQLTQLVNVLESCKNTLTEV